MNDQHISEETIQEYLDGQLSEDRVIIMQQHLAGCERCRQNLQLYQKLYTSLGEEINFHLSPHFANTITKHVSTIQTASSDTKFWETFMAMIGIFTGILVSLYFTGVQFYVDLINRISIPPISFEVNYFSMIENLLSDVNILLFLTAILILGLVSVGDRLFLKRRIYSQ